MTLILTCTSEHCVVQVSDRRLTLADGSRRSDLAVKMICIICQNAYFSLSYAGLAEVQGVKTDERVVRYLASINAGSMAILPLLESLQSFLTESFKQLRYLGNGRAITFAFGGFSVAGPFMGLLSNIEDEKGQWLRSVDDEFHLGFFFRKKGQPKLDVMINGAEIASDNFTEYLPSFRQRYFKRPPSDISKASVQFIRQATYHPQIGNWIGKNCLSTIVMPDGQFICDDYSEATLPQHHSPHYIGPNVAYKGLEIWTGDEPPPWWKD